jgi:spore coat protein U-like protein
MVKPIRGFVHAVCCWAALAVPASADAQSFGVSAEIVLGCALHESSQSSGIDFGMLDFGTHSAVLAGAVSTSLVATGGGPVSMECTQGMTFQLSIDGGQHAAGSERRLEHATLGSHLVSYALYTSSAMTTPIAINTNLPLSAPANGQVSLPVFAVATLPGRDLMPGVYSDTLQLVISW